MELLFDEATKLETFPEEPHYKHIVLWSGGTDSTLLLYELAMKYSSADHPILALTINTNVLDQRKAKKEKESREKLKDDFKKLGKFIDYDTLEVNYGKMIPTHIAAQAAIWINNIITVAKHNSIVYIGYNEGDSVCPDIQNIRDINNALCELMGKSVSLCFPYLYFDKPRILEKLMESGLYEDTWTCEMPTEDGKECNKCNPCNHHIEALLALSSRGFGDLLKEHTTMNDVSSLMSEWQKMIDTKNRV